MVKNKLRASCNGFCRRLKAFVFFALFFFVGSLFATTAAPSALEADSRSLPRASVFFITNKDVVTPQMKINARLTRSMLDQLLCAATGQPDVKKGWQSLLKTGKNGDRIGIKVASEPGSLGGTHAKLIKALVDQLVEAGVERDHIFIGDRRRQDLEKAGFMKRSGFQLRWMEYGNGYDPQKTFLYPLMGGLVYGDFAFKEKPTSFQESLQQQVQCSNESHYALFVTQQVDKIINVPSLCDSWYTGINGALVNMSLGVIDNWRRFVRRPYFGNPYVGMIYQAEPMSSNIVMTIMDGLMLQYGGGPQPNPLNVVSNGMLLASRDPVALDATALTLINQQRELAHLPKIQDLAGHIQSAGAAGLGSAKNIQVLRVKNNPLQ